MPEIENVHKKKKKRETDFKGFRDKKTDILLDFFICLFCILHCHIILVMDILESADHQSLNHCIELCFCC